MYNSKIAAFEKYVPDNIVTNDDLSKVVDTSDEWISTRTGIKQRRISKCENTAELCFNSAKRLLDKTGLSPLDIDMIITATITSDYMTPSVACIVQGRLGAENAVCFDLSAACSGFVYALSTADKFIKSGACRNVIVIGGETLSKILDWNDRATCVLFGDGAGSALVTLSDEKMILAEDLHSDGVKFESLSAGYVPVKNPFYNEKFDENSFYMQMNGREIFNFAVKKVPESILAVSEKVNVSLSEVKYIVPHQANSRIVESIAKKLKISMDKFYLNLDKFGNTSAASIPIALCEMEEKGLIKKDDKIIITGFGGGLTWGSMLFKM
jgi:3-oxoacyl-[acyl-carrier-protein] synthase-3